MFQIVLSNALYFNGSWEYEFLFEPPYSGNLKYCYIPSKVTQAFHMSSKYPANTHFHEMRKEYFVKIFQNLL